MSLNTLKIIVLTSVLILASCYHQGPQTSDAWSLTEKQVDSISFYTTHHYTQNYNFRIRLDSLQLIVQHPTEAVNGLLVDTIAVFQDERIVVADIIKMQADSIDSVWVKVARDQSTQGWVHESQMLQAVSPDTPISRFIDFFSDTHLLIFLAFFSVVAASYLIMQLKRRNARLVHFNDIQSFYPTLLAILVAASAVFYSTIQLYNPESWRHYYYHPTLNPFAVPLHIGIFLLYPCLPAFHHLPEGIQFGQRALRQLQVEHDRLLDNLPQADVVQMCRFYDFSHGGITNTACRIVDDTPQCLLIAGIGHHTEVGNHVFDLLTLIETQSTVDAIRDAVFAHLFLEATALGIGAIEDGKVGILAALLPADATDVVAHDDGLLLVAVGRLQR